jgi:hypothetical protein
MPDIDSVAEMFSHPFHPDLVINMDEMGFISRLLKGSRKNCVLIQNATMNPWFLKKPDANHGTLVGVITPSSYSLLPLLLSTRLHLPAKTANSYVAGEFCYIMTAKGHLTGAAMNFWIDHVLLPYIQDVRFRLRNLSTAILIINGLRSHNTALRQGHV